MSDVSDEDIYPCDKSEDDVHPCDVSEDDVQQDIDDLDLLDYSSQSQPVSEYGDSDELLRHPSNSQQLIDEELDRQDLLIKQEIAEEEERRKAEEEHQKIVSKHRPKSTVIETRPPGLKVFQPEHQTALTFSDLSREKHFGWEGLEEPEDLMGFLRYLTPEVSHNAKITSSEEFHSVVHYIFSQAVFSRDRQLFQVLRKCLSDLLTSYSYPWVLSLDLYVAHLVNLGADPHLINNSQFYQENQEFCQEPTVSQELSDRSQARPLEVKERLTYLSQLLQITSDVLVLPCRLAEYEAVDPTVWHSFIFITSVVAQEETIINQAEISDNISKLLYNLLIQISEESFQDITQLITAGFCPAKMSESSTSTWRSEQLPGHFSVHGLNHPHNMVHLTSLLPAHSPHLQQLVSYMFIQLILNNQDCDLPGECHVEDLTARLEINDGELKKSWVKLDVDEQLYSCFCLLLLLDILVLRVSGRKSCSRDI